jgi:hypothetical protein
MSPGPTSAAGTDLRRTSEPTGSVGSIDPDTTTEGRIPRTAARTKRTTQSTPATAPVVSRTERMMPRMRMGTSGPVRFV